MEGNSNLKHLSVVCGNELSRLDENNIANETDEQLEDDSIESIYEAIPYLAKLLVNLNCSLLSENHSILITNVDVIILKMVTDRLSDSGTVPLQMFCHADNRFSLTIPIDRLNPAHPPLTASTLRLMECLPVLGAANTGADKMLLVDDDHGKISVPCVTADGLSNMMQRLKMFNIKPRRIDPTGDKFYTVSFTEDGFPSSGGSLASSAADDVKSQRTPTIEFSVSNFSLQSRSSFAIKKPRGRPRIRPIVTKKSTRQAKKPTIAATIVMGKRPRGRPRRSENLLPSYISQMSAVFPINNNLTESIFSESSSSFVTNENLNMTL